MSSESLTSTVHSPLLTAGSRWLYHLSLHCLPFLSPNTSPIFVHPIPYCATNSLSFSSCSAVQISAKFWIEHLWKQNIPNTEESSLGFGMSWIYFLCCFWKIFHISRTSYLPHQAWHKVFCLSTARLPASLSPSHAQISARKPNLSHDFSARFSQKVPQRANSCRVNKQVNIDENLNL